MILPAGENPVKRVALTERIGGSTQRTTPGQTPRFQVNADPATVGHVPEILDQAVTHIDHRGGAQPPGLGPGRVVRLRAAVRGQQGGRLARPACSRARPAAE